MPHARDAAAKFAFDLDPRAWLALVGLPVPAAAGTVTVYDSDLATVSSAADKIVRIDDGVSPPFMVHLEFQAFPDPTFDLRMFRYSALIAAETRLPVFSAALLFQRAAARGVTGRVSHWYDEYVGTDFRFRAIRVWELPVEPFLTGPAVTLSLAPLASVTRDRLPWVMDQVARRLAADPNRATAADLFEVVRQFAGLRTDLTAEMVEAMMGTFSDLLQHSSTYQATLKKGRAEGLAEGLAEGRTRGAQDLLLEQGKRRFGPPPPAAVDRVRAVANKRQINRLIDRLLTAKNWDDWLGK